MLASLALHPSWIVFFGTLVLGESVVLTAAALAARGTWSLVAVVLWCLTGTIVADALWFHGARVGFGRWTTDERRAAKLAKASRSIDRVVGRRPHLSLLYVKFIYGTRIASLAYLATKDVGWRRFLVFETVGTALWLAVFIPIGWLMGRQAGASGLDLQHLRWGVLAAVLGTVAAKGVSAWTARHRS